MVRRHSGVVDQTIAQASNTGGVERSGSVARDDSVCLIDDDAIARPDWLESMAIDFTDPLVGAVGRRDELPGAPTRSEKCVGRITRWGKLVGHHHVGVGRPREVDVPKGVNMAIRRDLLALPGGLRGGSTQDHLAISMRLSVAGRAFAVVHDPDATVDHFPAPRVDGSRRFSADRELAGASAFNLVFNIASRRPHPTLHRALFGSKIGGRRCAGSLRGLVAPVPKEPSVSRRVRSSLRGQGEALAEVARRHPPRMLRISG